jgi:hypothetical protein
MLRKPYFLGVQYRTLWYEISAQKNSAWEAIPDPPVSMHNTTKFFSQRIHNKFYPNV